MTDGKLSEGYDWGEGIVFVPVAWVAKVPKAGGRSKEKPDPRLGRKRRGRANKAPERR